jgi:hypothetical protein
LIYWVISISAKVAEPYEAFPQQAALLQFRGGALTLAIKNYQEKGHTSSNHHGG